MACIVMAYIRARKYLRVTVAYGTCTMPIWLSTTCPKTLIVTLGDVLGVRQCKKPRQSNSFRLRQVWRRGAMRSWKCRFRTCANERVWMRVKLQSHALKLKGNGPLDPRWVLQCRKLGVDIFFWSSWGSNTSSLEIVRERHAWPALINPTWSKGCWALLLCGLYYYSHEFE